MIKVGQIVEIPALSSIYIKGESVFSCKKEELAQKIKKRKYNLFDGFLVGEHQGVEAFKLGQRKGINVGGKKEPLYIIGINKEANQLFVGEGDNHPGLFTDLICFPIARTDFQNNESIENGSDVTIISSAFQSKINARIYIYDDILYLELEKPNSITLQNGLLEISFKNNNHTTIKIN
ncbi:tRNA methyl transferase PRC-barrel domain-containing protein [Epilithonimonas hispanica]|uniref:tRNA-specific 2-thiouridylase MnmA-like central domain-containing protein n=1 Tax=Epilithonimonas hispanica TaxID=358687 RepID=A0A3D9CLP5_9FLAO|nr:tRNA methyl transferase PRC-barrel domain-containing protein [Epilithonimonas hispanica]REC66665.1 hypothetical protein DRF58_16075 [Epilithonimonas hispanica]